MSPVPTALAATTLAATTLAATTLAATTPPATSPPATGRPVTLPAAISPVATWPAPGSPQPTAPPSDRIVESAAPLASGSSAAGASSGSRGACLPSAANASRASGVSTGFAFVAGVTASTAVAGSAALPTGLPADLQRGLPPVPTAARSYSALDLGRYVLEVSHAWYRRWRAMVALRKQTMVEQQKLANLLRELGHWLLEQESIDALLSPTIEADLEQLREQRQRRDQAEAQRLDLALRRDAEEMKYRSVADSQQQVLDQLQDEVRALEAELRVADDEHRFSDGRRRWLPGSGALRERVLGEPVAPVAALSERQIRLSHLRAEMAGTRQALRAALRAQRDGLRAIDAEMDGHGREIAAAERSIGLGLQSLGQHVWEERLPGEGLAGLKGRADEQHRRIRELDGRSALLHSERAAFDHFAFRRGLLWLGGALLGAVLLVVILGLLF